MLAIQTVLCPTDFSERSDCAFRFACSLAKDHGARLIVLYVETPLLSTDQGELRLKSVLPPDYRDQLARRLRRYAAPDPNLPVEHRLEEGFAATEILRVAREANADLIVMGTHGRTGFGRLLMGSVAEEVLRKASCPVLTVKTPLPTDPALSQRKEPAQPQPRALATER